jgi:hypothetical protein
VRLIAAAQPVVELGDDAPADRGTELAERAGALGNRHGEQRLARFANLSTFGDEAQPIEIHVGAARHRDERLIAHAFALDPRLQPRCGERAGRLHDRARVVEDVLDGGAHFVVRDADDFVHRFARDLKGELAHFAHGDAVREDPHMIEVYPSSDRERLVHRVRLERLDANHLDVGSQIFR